MSGGYSSDGYFSADDYTRPNMALEFIHSARRIGFSRAPTYSEYSLGIIQATAKTAGNVFYGYDPIATLPAFSLNFPRLSASEVNDLVDFFENYARGQINDFTLYDWRDLTSIAVMFGEPKLTVTETGWDTYQVTIPLLKIA